MVLALTVLTMICWGSWTNVLKFTKGWRFELLYYDYSIGAALGAALAGLTFGTRGSDGTGFMTDLSHAGNINILSAFAGGQFLASAVAGDTTSMDALAQAQSWLTGLPNAVLSAHYQLYVLSDPRLQDQLFGVRAVPLPAALPAGLSLLAGIAVLRRLRRRS